MVNTKFLSEIYLSVSKRCFDVDFKYVFTFFIAHQVFDIFLLFVFKILSTKTCKIPISPCLVICNCNVSEEVPLVLEQMLNLKSKYQSMKKFWIKKCLGFKKENKWKLFADTY